LERSVITREQLRSAVAHVDGAPEETRKWIAALIRASASDAYAFGITDVLVHTDTRANTRNHDTQSN
jgi:hypothetical protein